MIKRPAIDGTTLSPGRPRRAPQTTPSGPLAALPLAMIVSASLWLLVIALAEAVLRFA